MTRRLIAIVLAVVTVSGAQGSLLYAAAGPVSGLPALAAPHQDGAAAGAPLLAAVSIGVDAGGIASLECLRGADACFDWGSMNCCGEFFTLMAIAGATGAWAAAGLAAWAYWYYCTQ